MYTYRNRRVMYHRSILIYCYLFYIFMAVMEVLVLRLTYHDFVRGNSVDPFAQRPNDAVLMCIRGYYYYYNYYMRRYYR